MKNKINSRLSAKKAYAILDKRQQRGAILPIALILLVVMLLGTVLSTRLAGTDELVNNNTRSRILALQSATKAMDYCREIALRGRKDILHIEVATNDLGDSWKTMSHWDRGSGIVNDLSWDDLGGNPDNNSNQPQCIIEDVRAYMETYSIELKDQPYSGYRITARGFSPAYNPDASGISRTGAQAWLQAVVTKRVK